MYYLARLHVQTALNTRCKSSRQSKLQGESRGSWEAELIIHKDVVSKDALISRH